jgi:hypothetical protein
MHAQLARAHTCAPLFGMHAHTGRRAFYHLNVEHAQSDANMEVRDGGGVEIYGLKSEGTYAVLWLHNASSVALYGCVCHLDSSGGGCSSGGFPLLVCCLDARFGVCRVATLAELAKFGAVSHRSVNLCRSLWCGLLGVAWSQFAVQRGFLYRHLITCTLPRAVHLSKVLPLTHI